MHYWGDEWKYWDLLYKVQADIDYYVFKYSRVRLISKEKYGTLRYEYLFAPPYSVCYKYPKGWLNFLERLWRRSCMNRWQLRWACYLVKRRILHNASKYPEIALEILTDAVVDTRFRFKPYYKTLCGWRDY
jgi:hypothetical protein